MIKTKDRLLLGMISGILAAMPIKYLMRWQRTMGLTDRRYSELSAQLIQSRRTKSTRQERMLGNVINNIGVGTTGVFLSYLLSISGTERAFVKGMAVGSAGWIAIDGYLVGKILKKPNTKPLGPALSLFNHALFGGLTAIFVTKLGDEELFPNRHPQGFSGQHLSDQSYREVELPTTLRK